MSNTKRPTGPAHLAQLRAKGWTLRPAAKHLGVNFTHLHRVLTGERHSRRLLAKVAALPEQTRTTKTASPFQP